MATSSAAPAHMERGQWLACVSGTAHPQCGRGRDSQPAPTAATPGVVVSGSIAGIDRTAIAWSSYAQLPAKKRGQA